MKRFTFAVLALLAAAALAEAQSRSSVSPAPSLGPIGLPLSPIGLPLPTIGLPLPAIGLQPPQPPPHRGGPSDRIHDSPSRSRDRRGFHSPSTIVYFASTPYWGYAPSEQGTAPDGGTPYVAAPPLPPATGRLRLEVEPADTLQMFVDDEFVGTPQDIGAELELESGSRRIELRAPGYETLVFDARIVGQRSITYRGALKALVPPAPVPDSAARRETDSPAAPPRRQTFYLIPGCYMGNIPPHEVKLPAGCDLSRVITHTP